jgi:SagB-type dehydrogenase family enzyme
MSNRHLEATWAYHSATKHSYQSIRTNSHYLDWENQPLPFKIYSSLEPTSLPRNFLSSEMTALSAISAVGSYAGGKCIPDLEDLARILHFSAGVTKRRTSPGGEIFFRAAACTGALYHIDLYLVCSDLPGLEAGVYHFGPHDFALRRLRVGDYREALIHASAGEPAVASAPAILICTGTYWRNAWKYQARTYRHCYWDTGTILANLLAVAAAREMPAQVVNGFVDAEVNRLLDLDTEREVALTLVALGHAPDMPPRPSPEVGTLALPTVPLSKTEVEYPAIQAIHAASSLADENEVRTWRGPPPQVVPPQPSGRLFPLQPQDDSELPKDTVEGVILGRGSARCFARKPISFARLSTLLHRATRSIPADFLAPEGPQLNDLYLIVQAVDGMPAGTYVWRKDQEALELLEEGSFRQEAGYLGLGQELSADASVNVFFLADLDRVLQRFGNRGYRAAQLEASIIGGKLYLAAYAQGLGATGMTFFDDDVTDFFSPHAQGKSVMFLVALGQPVKFRDRVTRE